MVLVDSLHDNRVSLGIVAEGKYGRDGVRKPQEMLEREIENNQWVEKDLAQPKGFLTFISPTNTPITHGTGTHGLLLLGDAFCFLDPVFSSSLMLA